MATSAIDFNVLSLIIESMREALQEVGACSFYHVDGIQVAAFVGGCPVVQKMMS
jgi:hypothetical protein